MNRLQKKCLFAAIGFHLLLALILLVGPAFLASPAKLDDSGTLEIFSPKLIDGPSFGGGPKSPASAPAPTPQQPVAQVVQQPPPQTRAEAEPPKPAPRPVSQQKPQPVAQRDEPKSASRDIESTDSKTDKSKPKINTTLVTRRNTTSQNSQSSTDDTRRRANAISRTVRNLRDGLSSSTEIETPGGFGGNGEANANYAQVVKSIYQKSWIEPTDSASDEATAKVSVTIASDGTVIIARITQSSGDAQVDASVQRTLDRVKFIAPFPKGTTDKERTYIINFNLKAKRLSA